MNHKYKLVNKISNDIKKIEFTVNHNRISNILNCSLKVLIKGGLIIDYIAPFFLTGLITFNIQANCHRIPFYYDEKDQTVNIETLDTSNGIHQEYISSDYKYNRKFIEYSTGWTIDNNGLYSRMVTSYRLSDQIDLNDQQKIFNMSKEELEKLLVTTNIKTIHKNNLEIEDYIYQEAAIIIVNHKKADYYVKGIQSLNDDIADDFILLLAVLLFGTGANTFITLSNRSFREKLKFWDTTVKILDAKEIENLKQLLDVKRKNLDLINGIDNTVYPCELKKVKS